MDAIVIPIQAHGVQQFVASLRTVEQTVVSFERNILRAQEQGTRARQTTAKRETDDKEKAFQRVAREAERWQKEETRSAQKAEEEKTRAAEKWARQREQIQTRSALMAGRIAKQQADLEIAEAQRVYDARARFARSFGGHLISGTRAGVGSIVNTTSQIVQGALSVGGGFSIADSVSREVRLRGEAATLAASSMPDATTGRKMSTGDLLASARASANAYSMDPEEVLKGIGKFKDLTGDLKRGVQLAPEMARLATALGADTGELMSNAGNIAASAPKMSNADIMKLARVQTMQGMQGAVELKDMAKYGARLTAGASLFGGDRATNIATMGAIAQVARQHGGAASAAEATMASQRFATDVQKHAATLEKKGIKVSDGHGGMRSADLIMQDMLKKSGGDVTKLTQFGLGERGIRALTGFADIYRQAGGGKAGQDAVNAEFAKYTKGISDADVDTAAKDRLGEVDKQVTRAMNELKDAVGTELVPELLKLVPVLRDATPMFTSVIKEGVKFAEWFKDNPIKGVGAVVLAAIAKELAVAGIGEAVKMTLTRLIAGSAPGGGGVPVPGAGGAPGAPGMTPPQGVALALGVGAQAAFLSDKYDQITAGGDAEKKVLDMVKAGDIQGAQAMVAQAAKVKGKGGMTNAQAYAQTIVSASGYVNPVMMAADYVSGKAQRAVTGQSEADKAKAQLQASAIVDSEAIKKAIAQAVAEGAKNGMKSGAGTPGSADSPSRTQPLSARP